MSVKIVLNKLTSMVLVICMLLSLAAPAVGEEPLTQPTEETVYPEGSTVYADGTVMYADGTIMYADGSLVYADGTTVDAYGTTVYPDGTAVYADGKIVYADGTTAYPDGTTVYVDGTVVYPDGTIVYADGTTVHADGTTVDANGTTVYPDGTAVYADGRIVYADGTAVFPDGTTVYADGTTVYPDSTTVYPDGTTVYPDGTTVKADGTTIYPDGTTVNADGSTLYPDGTTAYPDGTIVYADGTTVNPDGTIVYADGTTLSHDGSTGDPDGSTDSVLEEEQVPLSDPVISNADVVTENPKETEEIPADPVAPTEPVAETQPAKDGEPADGKEKTAPAAEEIETGDAEGTENTETEDTETEDTAGQDGEETAEPEEETDAETEEDSEKNQDEQKNVIRDVTLSGTLVDSDGYTYEVSVSYPADCGIPAGAQLSVEELIVGTDAYWNYINQSAAELGISPAELSLARAFDISFVDPETGERYQPTKDVRVSILLISTPVNTEEELAVLHFNEAGEVQAMDAALNGEAIEFETGSFSVFTVLQRNSSEPSLAAAGDGTLHSLTITAASGEKQYNGTPLSADELPNPYTFAGLEDGDWIESVTVTGSQTDVGNSDSVASEAVIMRNGEDGADPINVTDQYEITYVKGTLTVTARDVTVNVTGSNNADTTTLYDGTEHSVKGYTASANYDGYVIEENLVFTPADGALLDGENNILAARTDAGTTSMGLAAEQFENTNPNFNVTFFVTDGYVTVSPAPVSLIAVSAFKNHDGTQKSVSGYTCSVEGLTFSGVTAAGSGTEAGAYPVSFSGVTLNETRDTTGNYVVTETVPGTLTIATLFTNVLEYLEGSWANWKITVNPDGNTLNEGRVLTVSASFSAGQSIDYSSISVSSGVSYEYRGSTGTYTIPDGTPVEIRYRTRIVANPGDTVEFSNQVGLLDDSGNVIDELTAAETRVIYPSASDVATTTGVYMVRLYVYGNSQMQAGIPGAEFILLDENRRPMSYKAGEHKGEAVIFTTKETGYADVRLNTETDGIAIEKNTRYYLEMIQAPEGYKIDSTLYSFLIADNPDYDANEYYNGDTLKVRLYPEEASLNVSVRFSGNYSLTADQQNGVDIILQKQTAENTWEELERHSYSEFSYGSLTFDAGNAEHPFEMGTTYRLIEENERPWDLESTVSVSTSWYLMIGSEASVQSQEFTVTEDNQNSSFNFIIDNEYEEAKMTITKMDKQTGQMLPGAVFGVWKAADGDMDENKVIHEYTTDDHGALVISGADGYESETLYFAAETKAPEGYLLPLTTEKFYFYFCNDEFLEPTILAELPAGETAVNLTRTYESLTVDNQKASITIPVMKTWQGNTWPAEVSSVEIGLYSSVNGSEPAPVYDETDGVARSVTLTKQAPYSNTAFKDLPSRDSSGNNITYSIKEEHVYNASAQDIIADYVQEYGVSDAGVYIVRNRPSTSLVVRKAWYDLSGSQVTDETTLSEQSDVTFDVYRSTQMISDEIRADGITNEEMTSLLSSMTQVRSRLTFGSENEWTMTVNDLERYADAGETYYYYVLETVPSFGNEVYEANEAGGTILIKNRIAPETVNVTVYKAPLVNDPRVQAQDTDFGFTLALKNDRYPIRNYTVFTDGSTALTTDWNGEVTFTLKPDTESGQHREESSIVLTLPTGVTATVTEAANHEYVETAASETLLDLSEENDNIFRFDVDSASDNASVTFTNTLRVICKVVDGDGHDHPYESLKSALAYIRENQDKAYVNGTATIQMLEDYVMPETDVFDVREGENIALTTAGSQGEFPFRSDNSTYKDIAIITRGGVGASMLTNAGTLTIGKIILDGANTAVALDGGIVNSSGTLTLSGDTTLQNSSVSGRGGAIYSSGTVNMPGGSITGNSASSGSAIYLDNATLNMTDGRIENNTGAADGAVVANSTSCKINLSGDPVIYGNQNTGNNAANLYVAGDSDNVINIVDPGLDSAAEIGVTAMETHREIGEQFATAEFDITANLDRFVNDEFGYRGKLKDGSSTHVVWEGLKLTISKVLDGDGGNTNDSFTLTLRSTAIRKSSYLIDGTVDYTVMAGSWSVPGSIVLRNVKEGSNISISPLPVGSYTIEEAASDYTPTYTGQNEETGADFAVENGVFSLQGNSTLTVTNRRTLARVDLTKTLVDRLVGTDPVEFKFVVQLTDPDGRPVSGFPLADGIITETDGRATVSMSPTNTTSAKKTLRAPVGAAMTITENAPDYRITVSAKTMPENGDGAAITDTDADDSVFAFTVSEDGADITFANERKMAEIELRKELVNKVSTAEAFTFTVKLAQSGGAAAANYVMYEDPDDPSKNIVTNEDGQASITFDFPIDVTSRSVTLTIPEGTGLTVTEAEVKKNIGGTDRAIYDTTYAINGAAAKTGLTAGLSSVSENDTGIVFTNTRKMHTVTVTNTVGGYSGNVVPFTFTATVTDGDGEQDDYDINGFTDGQMTFELATGQSRELTVPYGATLRVKETFIVGYETTVKRGNAGAVTATEDEFTVTGNTTLAFTNNQLIGLRIINLTSSTIENVSVTTGWGNKIYRVNEDETGQTQISTNKTATLSVDAGKTAILEIQHQTSVTYEQAYTVKGTTPVEGYYYTVNNEPSYHEFADPAILRVYNIGNYEVKGKLRYSVSDSTVTFTEQPLVSFDVNGGAWTTEMEGYHDRDGDRQVFQKAVTPGEKVAEPDPDPVYSTEEEIPFLGWTADESFSKQSHVAGEDISAKAYDFNTPVTAPLMLYAVWAKPARDTCTVSVKNATTNELNITVTLTKDDAAVEGHTLFDDLTTDPDGKAHFTLNAGESKNLIIPEGTMLVLENTPDARADSEQFKDSDTGNNCFTIASVTRDGTVTYTSGICKITDSVGNILYDSTGQPAVYSTLASAFTAYNGTLYTSADHSTLASQAAVKMLVDEYSIVETTAINFPNKMMTFTTADKDDADFPYVGVRDRSTIYRSAASNSCFKLSNVNSNITLTDIVLDGGSERDVKTAAGVDGGLINMAGGTLNIIDGTTMRNTVYVSYSNTSRGGAIFMNGGTLNVSAGLFSNLHAYQGGAICVTGGTLNVTGTNGSTRFENCCTEAADGDGGAIYYNRNSALTINGGEDKDNPGIVFQSCVARGNTASGGAIYATTSSNQPVTVSGCRFIECSARTTEANNAGNGGGAICANNVSAVYVSGCTFDACDTLSRGGAIVTYVKNGGEVSVAGSSFDNCNCKGQGGALAVYQPNQESASPSAAVMATTLIVEGCNFSNCSSGTNNGSGGAIQCYVPRMDFSDTEFTDCWAGKEGGAVNNYFANGYTAMWNGSFMNLTRCRFIRCRAEDRYEPTAVQHYGGGVNTKTKTVTVTGSYFEDCVSTLKEGGALHIGGQGTGSTATITGSTFKNCMAKNGGGALLSSHETLEIDNCNFYGCSSSASNGGAIYNTANSRGGSTQKTATITNCVFSADSEVSNGEACSAAVNGGSIWTRAQSVTIGGCTITGSSANGNGGAIYLSKNGSQSATISGGTITGCTAVNGSAVYVGDKATFSGASITENEVSELNSGAIHGGTLYFEGNVVVQDNTCSADSVYDHDVLMQNNNNTTIYTTAKGLDAKANVGVYVVDTQVSGHGLESKPFGTHGADGGENSGSSYLDCFFNDRDDELYGYKLSEADTKIYWGIYVCKITDAAGNTLKKPSGRDAVYQRLSLAFDDFTKVTGNKPVYVKMLVEDYYIQQEAAITKFPDADITLTTAGKDDVEYPYRGTRGTPCTISRDTRFNSANQMFRVSNANATFQLEDIILDGRKDKTAEQGNYRMIEATAGKVIVNGGTILRYGYVNNASGAAVNVSNANGSLEINSTEGKDVLFEHCYAAGSGNGGAVYAASSLEINSDGKGRTTFNDCYASHGGAIMVNGNSASIHVNIDGAVFRDCHSVKEGGAVYHNNNNTVTYDTDNHNTASDTTIKNSSFENCYTSGDEHYSYGGAIVTRTATLTVDTCTFDNCYAQSSGGAINHGAETGDRQRTWLLNTTFTNCQTNGTNTSYGYGGSVYTQAMNVVVEDCKFEGSKAFNHGGALYLQSNNANSTATITGGTTFENCSVTREGGYGAICSKNKALTIDNTEIHACVAPGYSGAVYMETENSALTITDGTKISGCYANQGGAIYLKSGVTMNLSGSPEFTRNGYTVLNGSVVEAANGACIYLEQGSKLNLSGSPKFSRNILPNQTRIVNGGITDNVRQDIYLAGYSGVNYATSIHVAGELTGDTIWVWPAENPHRLPGEQFATTEESISSSTLEKFRNALADGETGCSEGEFLAGVRMENDTKNAYWSKMYSISFRKIDNKAVGVADAEFTLYKDKALTVEFAKATSADGVKDRNAQGELLIKGETEFASIPIGVYYMKETIVPVSYKVDEDLVYLVLVGSPTLSPGFDLFRWLWEGDGPLAVNNAADLVQKNTVNTGKYYGIFPLNSEGKAILTRNLASANVGITNIRDDFEAYFMKVDSAGDALPNAAFTIYTQELDEKGNPVYNAAGYPVLTLWSRDGENYPAPVKSADGSASFKMLDGSIVPKGVVYFRELPIGTYFLKETSYPERNGSNRRAFYKEIDRILKLEIEKYDNGDSATGENEIRVKFTLSEWKTENTYEEIGVVTPDEGGFDTIKVTNTDVVCKLTDGSDNLLYELGLDGETLLPAIYPTLEDGFDAAQTHTLYSADGNVVSVNAALKLKALKDFTVSEPIVYASSHPLTFTTAEMTAKKDDRYIFNTNRAADTARAEIRRAYGHNQTVNAAPLITVKTAAGMTLENIRLDGQKGAATNTGRAVLVEEGSLRIFENVRLQNFSTVGNGGAVLMNDGTTITIDGGQSRTAEFVGNVSADGTGGALALRQGCTVSIQNVRFTGNQASSDGGAISFSDQLEQAQDRLTVTNAVFTSNTASGDGGAVFIGDKVNMTFSNSIFNSNTAAKDGGAVYIDENGAVMFRNSTFTSNKAADEGGALYASKTSELTLTRGSFRYNNAASGSAIYGDSAGNNEEAGAEIYIDGGTITGNKASGDDGGAINVGGPNAQIFFMGSPYVYGNVGHLETEKQKNVVLSEDSNGIIRTGEDGLGTEAIIGVYVIDGENLFTKHGQATNPFGTFGEGERARINPQVFINDRNQDLYGVAKEEEPDTIFWSGVAGSRRVILRKVEEANGSFKPKNNAVFNVDTDANLPTHAKGIVKTESSEETVELTGLTSGTNGILWIGELPYGVYYLKEIRPQERTFILTVDENGVGYQTKDPTDPSKTAYSNLLRAQ